MRKVFAFFRSREVCCFGATVLLVTSACYLLYSVSHTAQGSAAVSVTAPAPDPSVQNERRAFFEAAKVYGRAGCGDLALAELTAKHAIRTGLPASVIAAKVAIESACNPLAVSYKGAVGLTQVMPRVWASEYGDFRAVNLFNPDQNMSVGTDILSKLVKKHGLRGGLQRYLGTGPTDGHSTPNSYADRVMKLAGGEVKGKP